MHSGSSARWMNEIERQNHAHRVIKLDVFYIMHAAVPAAD